MKKYKKNSLSDVISTIGSMTLFLLFTGCLLMMIAVAAGTYGRISTSFDKTFGSSASLRYISNKLKSADSVRISDDGNALFLQNDGITDIIYFSSGALYEKSVSNDAELKTEGGSKLFELSDMNISEKSGFYQITVTLNGEHNSTFIRR